MQQGSQRMCEVYAVGSMGNRASEEGMRVEVVASEPIQ